MDYKEAISILKYVLGQSKERAHTRMRNKGITLYPDVSKEREAILKSIEALEKIEGLEVKVVTAEFFTDKPIEAKPEEVKFGGF